MHSSNPPNYQNSSPGPWHTGLCDCFEDVPNCLITYYCPCVTFGQIAEIVDQGTRSRAASAVIFGVLHHFFLCNGGCLYSCCYRTKLRNQYALVGSRCEDCCVHWCCLSCALSQEYRELKKQGFDMTIGWERNVERRRTGMPMPLPMAPGGMAQPMAPGGMTR